MSEKNRDINKEPSDLVLNEDEDIDEEEYPEFDQEKYDKVFQEMYRNRIELEEELKDLEFKEFPAGIKKQIYAHITIMVIISIAFLYLVIRSLIVKANFNWLIVIIYAAGIFYLLLRVRLLYLTAEIRNFITFSGVVINIDRKGLLQSKYYLVKLTDGEDVINFKYTGSKKLEKGLPISIYIDEDAIIKSSDEGLIVDHILGVEFSDSYNTQDFIGSDEGDELRAKDLFSNK